MDTSTPFECQSHGVVTLSNKLLVGAVKVQLYDLDWSHCSRQFDPKIVEYLKRTFAKEGCRRGDPKNNVEAIISEQKLSSLLDSSRFTLEELKESSRKGKPRLLTLPKSQKLQCIHGQHRLAAAAEFLSKNKDDQWWVVNIYSYPRFDSSVSKVIEYQGESFDHQTRFSDGEIYRHVRKYTNDSINLAKWKARLSKSKLIGLNQLLRHDDIREALGDLLVFPGILDGLELGNVQKTMALRCDEEILNYLRHIRTCWDQITLKDEDIQKQVTIETVKFLQLRAPTASKEDRAYISELFENGAIFSYATDLKRKAIKKATLRVKFIIPSLKSLHENVKYLSLGAMVLKDKLFDGNVRTTIQQKAFSKWTPPTTLPVELRRNHSIRYNFLSKREMWDLAYKQLWILVLRSFPQLSGISPRKEAGEDSMEEQAGDSIFEESGKNPIVEQELACFALSLGVKTQKLIAASLHNPRLESLYNVVSKIYNTKTQKWRRSKAEEMLDLLENQPEVESNGSPLIKLCFSSPDGESLERRWGRPFRNAYLTAKELLYLPNLVDRPVEELHDLPTSMYVQRDFFNAFFGQTPATIFENGSTHSQEAATNVNIADEILIDPDLAQDGASFSVSQNQPEANGLAESNEEVAPPSEEYTNIDDFQEKDRNEASIGDGIPAQTDTAIFDRPLLSRSQSLRADIVPATEKSMKRVHSFTIVANEAIQRNLDHDGEQLMSTQFVEVSAETSLPSQPLQEMNVEPQIEDSLDQLGQRTPIQSMHNLPAVLNSQDSPDHTTAGDLAEISIARTVSNSFPAPNLPQSFTVQESRSPIQSVYNLLATTKNHLGPYASTYETLNNASIQERSRTPIQSMYNLPATTVQSASPVIGIKEMEDRFVPQGSIGTQAEVFPNQNATAIFPINSHLTYHDQTRDPHAFRTPIQSMHNLPATVDVPPEIQGTLQIIETRNRPRALIQSTYNVPATDDIFQNPVSEDLEMLEAVSPEERFRTPIQSTHNLQATVQTFPTELVSLEMDANMTDSTLHPLESIKQPEIAGSMRESSKTPSIRTGSNPAFGTTANTSSASYKDRATKGHLYHFIEYDGGNLVPKKVYDLEEYLNLHKNWYLFGGASVDQAFIISPYKREWYIKKRPSWTFVFVSKKHGESWKRGGAKLMKSFLSGKKRNKRQIKSPLSINLNRLADGSQGIEASKRVLIHGKLQEPNGNEAPAESRSEQQSLSKMNHWISTSNQVNENVNDVILNKHTATLDLGTFTKPIRHYVGASLLTAEIDLQEKVKQQLGSSSIAFLLYESSDNWELSELQRKLVPQVSQPIATYYDAFTFDRSRENLREIAIDIRLAEKAEVFNLWIVRKEMRAQFLAHRDRSFDDILSHRHDGFSFEAGTGQEVGENILFESSDSDKDGKEPHSAGIMIPKSGILKRLIDAPRAPSDLTDDTVDFLLSEIQDTTKTTAKSLPAARTPVTADTASSTRRLLVGNEITKHTVTDSETSKSKANTNTEPADQGDSHENGTKDAHSPQKVLSRKRRYSATEQGDIIKIRNVLDDIIREPKRAKLHNRQLGGLSRKRGLSETEEGDMIKIRNILDDMIRKPKRAKISSDIETADLDEAEGFIEKIMGEHRKSKMFHSRSNESSSEDDEL